MQTTPSTSKRNEIESLFSASAEIRERIAGRIRRSSAVDAKRYPETEKDEVEESSYQHESTHKDRQRDDLADEDIESAVTIFDPRYPPLLREIYAPPLVLFVRGKLPNEEQPMLGVVGARKASLRTAAFIERLSKGAAERGVVIVSGLAYGIDAAVHKGALAARDGVTIAVLGTPLDRIYPSAHRWMAEEIVARGGALISTYPQGTPVFPSNFLERNRIIAGMSRAVFVGQAGARSGSLATARFALEENREVLALPGDVLDEGFAGSNRLLREGATVVTNLEEVLAPYEGAIAPVAEAESAPPLPEWLRKLPKEVIHFQEFSKAVPDGLSPHEAALNLELSGVIAMLPGDHVQRLR